MDLDQAIEMSLKNIAKHGDTDIFPFPWACNVIAERKIVNKINKFLLKILNILFLVFVNNCIVHSFQRLFDLFLYPKLKKRC